MGVFKIQYQYQNWGFKWEDLMEPESQYVAAIQGRETNDVLKFKTKEEAEKRIKFERQLLIDTHGHKGSVEMLRVDGYIPFYRILQIDEPLDK